ncbi:MAG: sigma-70 family RNA polymerase sigma factor [Planctomycetes bacterium]|nr:sigma-70 family RNA polymerase sigma factor [Planctomycetota bacterium]
MNDFDQRLSAIATQWTLLRKAHAPTDEAAKAQQEMMERYLGAVYRYLRAAVKDEQVADDLTQEFAVRFLSGRYRGADPERGRFRDYIKRCLFHLVHDHRRRQAKQPARLVAEPPDVEDAGAPHAGDDQVFVESWRNELLARAWAALEEHERQTGQPYHAVLRFRVDHPDLKSAQLAEELGGRLGRPMTAENVRQLLKRARGRFGELLLRETARSLGDPPPDRVEEELADLRLLKYCQDVIRRRRGG